MATNQDKLIQKKDHELCYWSYNQDKLIQKKDHELCYWSFNYDKTVLFGGRGSIYNIRKFARPRGGGRGVTKENKSNVVLVEPNPM